MVVVEGPTYLGAIQAFRSYEATLVAVPLDEHGLDLDDLERRLAGGLRPKLLYTIPDHQNPAGVSLAAERRTLLVELASRYGFLIVEDVAYRELGFSDESLPSLWSLAPDVVVQTGTTSKTLFPGVRLGWAVGPAEISARLVSAKQNTDQCAGALGQRLFEESLRRGWLDEQVVRSRALYRGKCEQLLAALERSLPDGAVWTRPQGGFFTWLTLPGDVDSVQLARARGGTRRRRRPRDAVLPGRPGPGHAAAVVQHGRQRTRSTRESNGSPHCSEPPGRIPRSRDASARDRSERVRSVVARGLAVVAAIVFVVAPVSAFGRPVAAPKLHLGLLGDPVRFANETEQRSSTRLHDRRLGPGIDARRTSRSLLSSMLDEPMIGLNTSTSAGERITPAEIARGQGDAFLLALNGALAALGQAGLRAAARRDERPLERLFGLQRGRLVTRARSLDRDVQEGLRAHLPDRARGPAREPAARARSVCPRSRSSLCPRRTCR